MKRIISQMEVFSKLIKYLRETSFFNYKKTNQFCRFRLNPAKNTLQIYTTSRFLIFNVSKTPNKLQHVLLLPLLTSHQGQKAKFSPTLFPPDLSTAFLELITCSISQVS